MEISELITSIREDYLSDDVEPYLWSDDALLRYLSEAQRQACNRTDFLWSDSDFNITLIDGVSSYKVDLKITFIEQVIFNGNIVNRKSIETLRRDFPDYLTDSGIGDSESFYTMRGHKLTIYPIPDATDAGNDLTIEAYHIPLESTIEIVDDLVIPDENHRDLIWWVLYEAFNKRDAETYNPNKSQEYKELFDGVFGEYVPSNVRLNQLQEDESLNIYGPDYSNNNTETTQW